MTLWTTLLLIAIPIVLIYLVTKMREIKHKFTALFLIALLLFFYLSFNIVFNGKNIDFSSVEGVKKASGLYFLWLGNLFSNIKAITAKVINMNWQGNKTS